MSFTAHALAKPVFAGLVSSGLDYYFLANRDMKSSALFGGSVALGIWATTVAEPYLVQAHLLSESSYNRVSRPIEVASGLGVAFLAHKYLLADANDTSLMANIPPSLQTQTPVGAISTRTHTLVSQATIAIIADFMGEAAANAIGY
jgi:hypothetical protein